jgi:Xaa-Pro aminopeptidase
VQELATDEQLRIEGLREAQAKAAQLFEAVEAGGLIRAGALESTVSDEIRGLAVELLGVRRHWHKRIVRTGPNTLEPFRQNPPNRVIAAEDIVFCDFGPIFEEWEADFGRTYVLGDDPEKLRLRDALPVVFDAGREHFFATPDITGEQLFDFMVAEGGRHGWQWGGRIAGHLVGEFPHEEPDRDEDGDIAPGSTRPMRGLDRSGRVCHWILEVHLVDRARQIGGFYEELLDL